jgi:acylphosphatase
MKTIRMIVKGKVQGVYYRASAKKSADQLGIKGWAKNLPDSSVEIIAVGSESALQKFTTWCWQGPPGASVKEVVTEVIPDEWFSGFRIKR